MEDPGSGLGTCRSSEGSNNSSWLLLSFELRGRPCPWEVASWNTSLHDWTISYGEVQHLWKAATPSTDLFCRRALQLRLPEGLENALLHLATGSLLAIGLLESGLSYVSENILQELSPKHSVCCYFLPFSFLRALCLPAPQQGWIRKSAALFPHDITVCSLGRSAGAVLTVQMKSVCDKGSSGSPDFWLLLYHSSPFNFNVLNCRELLHPPSHHALSGALY